MPLIDDAITWIDQHVKSVSWSEVIESYRMWHTSRTQARFARVLLWINRTKKPWHTATVSIYQDDRKWRERGNPVLSWRAGVFGAGSPPYFCCVARTDLRHKGSAGVERIGFLRVSLQGVIFLTANNDRIPIAIPETLKAPPEIQEFLTPGPNGTFVMSSRPHPQRAVWDEWEGGIASMVESLRAQVEMRGAVVADRRRYEQKETAACAQCGRHPAQDRDNDAVWRMARNKLYCATCAERDL